MTGPQLRGPLPLKFRRRDGRIAVQAEGDYSTAQSAKAGTTGANGFVWPKVEREQPFPGWRHASKVVDGKLRTIAVSPSGTRYLVSDGGALVRLDDGSEA